jgi:hypothetical protein
VPPKQNLFLRASRYGYFEGNYGSSGPEDLGRTFVVSPGGRFSDATIRLWRPAAISGNVIDEFGDPVVDASVQAVSRIAIGDQIRLVQGVIGRTDDRGEYRLSGLSPGSYLAMVPGSQWLESSLDDRNPRDNLIQTSGRPVYPCQFFPGVIGLAHATPILLGYGTEHKGATIRLSRARMNSVTGRLLGPSATVGARSLRLVPVGAEALGTGGSIATTLSDAEGRFTFSQVPEGHYTAFVLPTYTDIAYLPGTAQTLPSIPAVLQAPEVLGSIGIAPPGTVFRVYRDLPKDSYWGMARADVDTGPVRNLDITLQPTRGISGTIVFEGKATLPAVVTVRAEPASGETWLGVTESRVSVKGSTRDFTLSGLYGGTYVIRVRGTEEWVLRSVMASGTDHVDQGLDLAPGSADRVTITLTDQLINIEGLVRDSQDRPVLEGVVIAWPDSIAPLAEGYSPRRIRRAGITEGGFRLTGLTEGDYLLAAVKHDSSRHWADAQLRTAASAGAVRVSVRWGQSVRRDLRVQVVK